MVWNIFCYNLLKEWKDRWGLIFADCITEVEKNYYKCTGDLKREFTKKNYDENFEFYKIHRIGSYNDVFDEICRCVKIPDEKERFIYFIDPQYLFDTTRGYRFENLTVNYRKILESGLEALKYDESQMSNQFCYDYNRTIDSIELLADRIYKVKEKEPCGRYFRSMRSRGTVCLEEALQRILFVNQLFWQMGHRLMGLGRLDSLLYPFYENDIREKRCTKEDVLAMIKEFFVTIHKYYWLKSNVLMGDTGQIIVLGGRENKNSYVYNELTELFIEATEQLQMPDPKIVLRVSQKMPRTLMARALKCIKTGVGSPLLANDDVIVPQLLAYGVAEEDAHDYGTSACWEPLIQGKSVSLNNLTYLSYPKALQNIFEQVPKCFLGDKESFMEEFYRCLETEIKKVCLSISDFRFQYNPLLSLFTDDCFVNKKDVSAGGARYSNCGITTVGLSNTVNSILNIKQLVYEDKEYSIQQIREIMQADFRGQDNLLHRLKNPKEYFGKDSKTVSKLTNEIIHFTSKHTEKYRNYMGGTLKFGVSAPSYIDAAKEFPATFDGRKWGEAFGTHISAEKGTGYTEIVNFASSIDYGGNRFNGNVVDFMVSPHFIDQNFDKFVDFLMISIETGFFQLQMNVVNSQKLIDAKKNPDKYPDLVVRVWGFSAYFAELPESYQDVLIQRALENEGKVS